MKIGEHVSVLDDDLGGTITSVHGETVVFRDTHGFTHQYPKVNWWFRMPQFMMDCRYR